MKSDWSWRAGQLGSWRVGELGSQERRVIAFCVAEFKWKWIQYCIFTPKCFQKQIFHLHFLNGAIRITCPTGPKHWFCSCAMKGESRIPNPSHSPFRPPVAQRTRQPFHLPKKKKKEKMTDTGNTVPQRYSVFWMPFVGQRTRFRTLFQCLFWGN